jgi:hypothetical protein
MKTIQALGSLLALSVAACSGSGEPMMASQPENDAETEMPIASLEIAHDDGTIEVFEQVMSAEEQEMLRQSAILHGEYYTERREQKFDLTYAEWLAANALVDPIEVVVQDKTRIADLDNGFAQAKAAYETTNPLNCAVWRDAGYPSIEIWRAPNYSGSYRCLVKDSSTTVHFPLTDGWVGDVESVVLSTLAESIWGMKLNEHLQGANVPSNGGGATPHEPSSWMTIPAYDKVHFY